jgi:hypothetical protein
MLLPLADTATRAGADTVLATQRRKTAEVRPSAANRGTMGAVIDELRGSIALLLLCLLVVVTELWRR